MPKKPLKLVAIHLGAGQSLQSSQSQTICKNICEQVMKLSREPPLFSGRPSEDVSNCKVARPNIHTPHARVVEDSERHHTLPDEDASLSAEVAVVELVRRMEDESIFNCGFGSNLNIDGRVECDASLMCDKRLRWTGVGAVSDCRNPILLAKALYDLQAVPRPMGLIQPNLLVGSGAKQWMQQYCPSLISPNSKLVSAKALEKYQLYKSRYDQAMKLPNEVSAPIILDTLVKSTGNPERSRPVTSQEPTSLDHGFYCAKTSDNLSRAYATSKPADYLDGRIGETSFPVESTVTSRSIDNGSDGTEKNRCESLQVHRLDTVGAVAVDCDNNFASAISSGGIVLKFKGRVGQAAVPGAGCWSEDSVAVATTGVGEYLTSNLFAKKFHDKIKTLRLLHDMGHVDSSQDLCTLINRQIEECFEDLMKSTALDHVAPENRFAGMLSVCSFNSRDFPCRSGVGNDLFLSFAHNTNSMCIGYMRCNDRFGNSIWSCPTELESQAGMTSTTGKETIKTQAKTLKFSFDSNESVEL